MFKHILVAAVAAGLAASMPAAAADSAPELISVAARPILYVPTRAPANDPAATGEALGVAYGKIGKAMTALGVQQAGAPLAITRSYDPKGDWVFDAAIPLPTAVSSPFQDAEVKAGNTPQGRVVKVVHTGPYAGLKSAYDAIEAFLKEKNLKPGTVAWEEYASDPGNTPEDQLVTNVYFQVAP